LSKRKKSQPTTIEKQVKFWLSSIPQDHDTWNWIYEFNKTQKNQMKSLDAQTWTLDHIVD
jgi:hypothetical protein